MRKTPFAALVFANAALPQYSAAVTDDALLGPNPSYYCHKLLELRSSSNYLTYHIKSISCL